jgi:hypothetical protein
MSVLPKASARSCPSSRAMKIATASSIPPGCPPPPSIGGLSSRRLTNTRYPSPCFTRDTAAAVADGIAFLAFKIVITTSATRRVCTCCQSGGALSPDEERVLGGMPSVCRSGMRLLIVETTTVVTGFPALRLCGFPGQRMRSWWCRQPQASPWLPTTRPRKRDSRADEQIGPAIVGYIRV